MGASVVHALETRRRVVRLTAGKQPVSRRVPSRSRTETLAATGRFSCRCHFYGLRWLCLVAIPPSLWCLLFWRCRRRLFRPLYTQARGGQVIGRWRGIAAVGRPAALPLAHVGPREDADRSLRVDCRSPYVYGVKRAAKRTTRTRCELGICTRVVFGCRDTCSALDGQRSFTC